MGEGERDGVRGTGVDREAFEGGADEVGDAVVGDVGEDGGGDGSGGNLAEG